MCDHEFLFCLLNRAKSAKLKAIYKAGHNALFYFILCFKNRTKSAKLKANYKADYVNVEGDVDLLMTGPTFKGALVLM